MRYTNGALDRGGPADEGSADADERGGQQAPSLSRLPPLVVIDTGEHDHWARIWRRLPGEEEHRPDVGGLTRHVIDEDRRLEVTCLAPPG